MPYYLMVMSMLLLSACGTTYVMPKASSIPWQYPVLSTTGCPDLSGVYINEKGYQQNGFLSSQNKSIDIGKPDFFEIKQQADGLNVRYWNKDKEAGFFTKFDGLEIGCIDNKLITHTYDKGFSGGGETWYPLFPYILYYEDTYINLANGDLEDFYQKGKISQDTTGVKIILDSQKSSTYLIKRAVSQ